MGIIMDYYFNNTRIIVDDDCCCSADEVEAILKRIGEIATHALNLNKQQEDKSLDICQ